MSATAPEFDNVRMGGPDGIRIPQEAGRTTFSVKGFKAVDRGSASGSSVTINLSPNFSDALGAAEASYIEVDNALGGTGATVVVLPGPFPGHRYVVFNNTGKGAAVTFQVAGGRTGVTIADGSRVLVACHATDVVPVAAIGALVPSSTYTTVTTVGAQTLSAANVDATAATGLVVLLRTGTQNNAWTDTTPAASAIISAIAGWQVGQSYIFRYCNADVALTYTATLAGGSSVTIIGTATIPHQTYSEFLVTYTGTGTVSFTFIGTGNYS